MKLFFVVVVVLVWFLFYFILFFFCFSKPVAWLISRPFFEIFPKIGEPSPASSS